MITEVFALWMAYDRRHAGPDPDVIACPCGKVVPHPAHLLGGSLYQCSHEPQRFFLCPPFLALPSYQCYEYYQAWRRTYRKVLNHLSSLLQGNPSPEEEPILRGPFAHLSASREPSATDEQGGAQ